MAASPQRFGLSCALATPFLRDGSVDTARLVAHVRSRLEAGCSSVTICGTTGEGASLGLASRERMLFALRADGIDMEHEVVMGVAASSTEEAIAQAAQAFGFGCKTVLLAPPFYFKDASDEGLASWFAAVLAPLAEDGMRAILYHILPVTAVPLSLELIGALKERFPGTVMGVKDSSGDRVYAHALIARHRDLVILIGDERLLAEAVRLGAAGAISGLANIVPGWMLPLANEGRDDPRIAALVEELVKYSVIPGLKELVAHQTGDGAWRKMAPPLEPMAESDARRLREAYDAIVR
jgi:4-hydroxy-tetrahydrodipicolinate synthase